LGGNEYPDWIHGLPENERSAVVCVEDHLARWPVFSDRPAQAALRKYLQPALTRTALAPLAPGIRASTASLAGGLPDTACDLLADFARPAALRTITSLLGLPPEHGPVLEDWSNKLIGYLTNVGLDVDLAQSAQPAVEGLTELVRTHLVPSPTTAATAQLAQAFKDDQIELADVVAMVAQIVTGGIEPTATATCAMVLAATRGDDSDEESLSAAMESALRSDPPFHFAPRVVKTDFSYQGHEFRQGQRVVLILASAGQDEATGYRPDRCPVSAAPSPVKGHLAFGRGRHFCLGVPLVTIHLGAALLALRAAGVPDRVDRENIERGLDIGSSSFRRFPLRARSALVR
jgi:cytochrome P450